MKPAVNTKSGLSNHLKLGLGAGMLGIAAGIIVSLIRFNQGANILDFPTWSWPMLVPGVLGLIAVVLSVIAVMQTGEVKRPAMVFGVGLLAIATPYLIVLLGFAIVIAVIFAVVSG